MGRDPLRICVLDTGKGGQGLRHMARLLRELHDTCASGHLWTVKFNVIEPISTQGALVIEMPQHLSVLPDVNINAAVNNTICQAVTAQLMQGSENYFVGDIWDYNYRLPDIGKILKG